MRQILALMFMGCVALPTFTAHAQNTANTIGTSVYGGQKVQNNDAPWQALIYLANKGASSGLLCGATIVSSNWILTAAHCFYDRAGNRISTSLLGMATGTVKLSAGKQILQFEEPILMDGYTSGDWDKDIALVRLITPVSGRASPIILASTYDEKSPPSSYFVAGWGKTETAQISDNLLFARLKPISLDECAKFYPNRLTSRTLCAGDPPRDSCHGDSGGPLYVGTGESAMQYGIVAAGEGCGKNPGVYVRVSQHRAWIEKTLAATGDKLANARPFKPSLCTPEIEAKKLC